MATRSVYYRLKPFIPWAVRIALRRWYAKRVRARTHGEWPILETAGTPPRGWPGWPEKKKFAFVLTHDVERKKGLDRCIRLSQMEKERGFRSAFYFVPEGEYSFPTHIRKQLEN